MPLIPGLRAIMVSVDMADLLSITLPWNRHHFDEVWVVTSVANAMDYQFLKVCAENGADTVPTDAFYRDGAAFNKWLALEEGLDRMGRRGWLALMDVDVLWPKEPCMTFWDETCLYAPRRRMWANWPQLPDPQLGLKDAVQAGNSYIPAENDWKVFPLHRQEREWAGYSQIFNVEGSADLLGAAPWHETDWQHAGGADSRFQARWPQHRKIRPPWEVLHLGESGVNWYGRATPRLDGSVPEGVAELRQRCADIWRNRRKAPPGTDKYAGERIKKGEQA